MASIDLGRIGGPIVIPNCIMMRLKWTSPGGRVFYNVLHGQVAGGFTPTVAMANALQTAINAGGLFAAVKPYWHSTTGFNAVELLDLRTASQPIISSTGGTVVGTGALLPLAVQTALVVTWRTAKTGQANRGRSYFGGWAADAQQATQIALPAAVTALAALANGMITYFTAQGIAMCIAHPARAAYTGSTGTPHAARAAETVPITAAVVRNGSWDTQRRRAGRT